jgi:gluconate:H+ symporter, GntP family
MTDPLILVGIGILIVVGGIIGLRLHPFLALLLGTIFVAMLSGEENLRQYAVSKGLSESETHTLLVTNVGARVAKAFGNTIGKIGILIAMASIIANALYRSGAADKIIRSLVRTTGEERAPVAFLLGSFTLGIPVFFDTVFYLMFPLARTMAIRSGRNYALYLMAIIGGGVMAHSLVPPTPGPLYMAAELGVSVGLMILMGLFVGLFTSAAGYLYALWSNRRYPVPIRTTDAFIKDTDIQVSEKDLPPLWLSILPILVPVVFISGGTILQLLDKNELISVSEGIMTFFRVAGNSNLALTVAAGIGLVLLVRVKGKSAIKTSVPEALQDAGVIILIIGAGGAFGAMMEQTGISTRISGMFHLNSLAILPVIFLISALVRTAQGSATVSMITTVGMVGGLAQSLPFHPVYVAMVIGCGSKIFNWMNDSSFWVTCKMSGMTEKETFRNNSVLLTVMGIVGLFVIMILATIFPLKAQ